MSEHLFIDNRGSNTLAAALKSWLDAAAGLASTEVHDGPNQVRIATAFFSPTGFAHVADRLKKVPAVRLLLGADTAADPRKDRRELGESQEGFVTRRVKAGLRSQSAELERERDWIPFNRTNGHALSRLIAALRAGNLEVRRYEQAFLHAKAYLITPSGRSEDQTEAVVVGSSNMTGAGLTHNLELNLGLRDPLIARQATEWFDDLWLEAEPFDLAEVFEVAVRSRSPWDVFVRVLWQLYGEELEEEGKADEKLPLTSFQKHGVARALRLIRETGGTIVADEVGLGKTFIAGEIIQIYRRRRQRALLICPASLRDSTWRSFLAEYELYLECVSFEQLASDVQLRDQQRPNAAGEHLKRSIEEYQLVIVDEAHNYRNPGTPTRAAALRRLLFGARRDLLLLTATPVNNSLWDLYHLLRFFLRQDAHLASRGIPSIRERFEEAMHMEPTSLHPDVLFPIIDATTVKRTRRFVKKHYGGDTITGPDGVPRTIVFPEPRAISVRYALEDRQPGFFDRLEEALDSEGERCVGFARYMPDTYRKDAPDKEENARARAMVGLLRTGLLKRFESSAYAFQKTVDKMVQEHESFLDALDAGYVVTTAFLQELSGNDEDIFEELLEQSPDPVPVSEYRANGLRRDVHRDLEILQGLLAEARAITSATDTKLGALSDELALIATEAEYEATDAIDEAQRRKVLVFSFFVDTVEWIKEFLDAEIKRRPDLHPYRKRMATVSGSGHSDKASRRNAVLGFAPVSMQAPAGQDDDLYDLLITTDVLAEGVNLQQCRHIINYDMPWNPMRLVQRHGRIDRIGSKHGRVFLRTFFPEDRLDQLLNLHQRILGKLAMAAASVGVRAPIEGAAHGRQVFTETRMEIEKLIREDATLFERGGTEGAALTGEEFRQTLRKELSKHADHIRRLPWKIGSGMIRGKRRGVFFCAVVGAESDHERTYLRFVPATDDWQPQADRSTILREQGTCLRLIECEQATAAWVPDGLQDRVYDFWDIAQADVFDHWTRETDPAYLQPQVRPLNLRVAKFIRDHPPHGVAIERVHEALDILESPWPRREEIMLRGWFGTKEDRRPSLASTLVERILETGLEASRPPQPLPPIEQDDIRLLCWMAIEQDDSNFPEMAADA